MSLPSRFAGSITASFIGRVMRPLGGRSSTSIHFQSHSGSGSIVRPIASTPGRNCRADQRRCRRGRDREAGLLLSVYVPGISGLLHRQSRCQPQGLVAKSNTSRHRGQLRPRMAPPRRRSGDDRTDAGPNEPTTHTDAAEAPATVALRKPPPTIPPRRPPPIIPARKPPPRRWNVVEHDVDGGVHVSV